MNIFPSLALGLLLAVSGYQEALREHGVVVLRREGSSAIDLVAEGEVAAAPSRVRALLLDYDRHAGFIRHLAESHVIARTPTDLFVYQRLDLPVIADRDVTFHVTFGEDGDALWVKFAAENERGPAPRRGVVRMPVDEGAWRLTPIDGGRATRIRFSLRIELAGSVPRFIARSRAAAELPDVFVGIRKQLSP